MLLIIKKKMIIPLEIHTLFYTLSRGLALAKKSSIISRLRKKWMAQGLKSISMELSCAFSSPIFCPQRPPKVCSVAGRENCKKNGKRNLFGCVALSPFNKNPLWIWTISKNTVFNWFEFFVCFEHSHCQTHTIGQD